MTPSGSSPASDDDDEGPDAVAVASMHVSPSVAEAMLSCCYGASPDI